MEGNCFTILWWFLPYINICQMYTHVLPSWAPSHLLLHSIPLGCSRTSALGALLHASNLHWSSILHMVIYVFQCYSLIQISNAISVSLNHTFKVASIFDSKRMCTHLVLDVPAFLFQFFCLFISVPDGIEWCVYMYTALLKFLMAKQKRTVYGTIQHTVINWSIRSLVLTQILQITKI